MIEDRSKILRALRLMDGEKSATQNDGEMVLESMLLRSCLAAGNLQ
jgi:hypothetical protein